MNSREAEGRFSPFFPLILLRAQVIFWRENLNYERLLFSTHCSWFSKYKLTNAFNSFNSFPDFAYCIFVLKTKCIENESTFIFSSSVPELCSLFNIHPIIQQACKVSIMTAFPRISKVWLREVKWLYGRAPVGIRADEAYPLSRCGYRGIKWNENSFNIYLRHTLTCHFILMAQYKN